MHFVYPRDLIEPKQVEEVFRDEAALLQKNGHMVSLIDTDALVNGSAFLAPPLHKGETATYRGWMLKPMEYENLVASLGCYEAMPLTTTAQYLNTHHLPRWYGLLSDVTPETVVVEFAADYADENEMVTTLNHLNWPAYFVKDFVKSHKTGRGSVLRNPSELPALLAEMRKFRGELEGGICIRRFEEFVPGSEKRYFALRGTAHGADEGITVPAIAADCARRIDSPFFSIDVAERSDGILRVVEIGDGQVSDLVGWDAAQFAALWKTF